MKYLTLLSLMLHSTLWAYASAILQNLRQDVSHAAEAKQFHEEVGQCFYESWDCSDDTNRRVMEVVKKRLHPDHLIILDQTTKNTTPPQPSAAGNGESIRATTDHTRGTDEVVAGEFFCETDNYDEAFVPDGLYDSDNEETIMPLTVVESEPEAEEEEDEARVVQTTHMKRRGCGKGTYTRRKKGAVSLSYRRNNKTGGKKDSSDTKGVMQSSYNYQPVSDRKRKRKKKKPPPPEDTPSKLSFVEQRLLVSYYYVYVENAPGPGEWSGPGGTVARIVRGLEIQKGNYDKVKTVVAQTYECMQGSKRYAGSSLRQRGSPLVRIAVGSDEEQDIAKYKEDGCSFTETTDFLNDKRARNGNFNSLTRSAVIGAYSRMNKVVTPVGKRAQGNSDANSAWAKARRRWITQLALCMGLITEDNLLDFMVDGVLPPAFDRSKLKCFNLDQIVWWDEVHKKCHIGNLRPGATEHVQFPRDKEGRYDPNGEYCEERAKKGDVLQVKYENEVRFCFGVAVKPDEDGGNGEEEGVRGEAFGYSGKRLVSLVERRDFIAAEIARKRALKPGADGYTAWVESARLPKALYQNDPISMLGKKSGKLALMSGLGDVTCGRLEENGLVTVRDVLDKLTTEKMIEMNRVCPSVKLDLLQELGKVCSSAIMTDAPKMKDHTLAANPYESKYREKWYDTIIEVMRGKGLVCVTELVTHIVRESAKVYKGTKYEHTWVFYHDALSLMTAKETVEWMKTQKVKEDSSVTYHDKWILPQHGLNKAFRRFDGKPIGNSPEMMPLDNCLNKDAHEAVARHVLMSRVSALDPEDTRVFSMKTPKKGASAYKRIWNNSMGGVGPPSKRIIQDITKVVEAMHQIMASKGAFVPNLAQRPGDRHIINQLKSRIWGGKRTKKAYVAMLLQDRKDLHADLKSLMKERDEREGYQGSSRVQGLATPAGAAPPSVSAMTVATGSTGLSPPPRLVAPAGAAPAATTNTISTSTMNATDDVHVCAAGELCGMKAIPLVGLHSCMNCSKFMHGALCGTLWAERGDTCNIREEHLSDLGKQKTTAVGALICNFCMKR